MRTIRLAAHGLMLCAVLGGHTSVLAADPAPTAPTTAPAAGDSISLAPKFKKGDVASYDFEMSSTNITTVGDKEPGKQSFKQWGRLTRRVVSTTDSSVTLSITYDVVNFEFRSPNIGLNFDSTKPESEDMGHPLVKPMRLAVGVPLTITIDSSGAVTMIEGNLPPARTPDDPAPPHPGYAGTLFGDPIIKRTLTPLYRLPGAPSIAKPGATWSTTVQSPQPPAGTLTATMTHTLEGAGDGVARIAFTGKVELQPAIGNSAIKAELVDQKVGGSARWDIARGVLLAYTDNQHVKLQGDDYEGVKRIHDSTVTTVFTLVEDASIKPAVVSPTTPKP